MLGVSNEGGRVTQLKAVEPLAVVVTDAIRGGRTDALKMLLEQNAGLATATIADGCGGARTLLHVATDWPGNLPNGAETVSLLIAMGANVNARFIGRHSETPLHWAASCDDVAVLDALLDHGADIEAPGAVIAGGTPLADAVAFGQWKAARRLVERGARSNLWQAAGLGLLERVQEYFASDPPSTDEITKAFWLACHGGQRGTAEYLMQRGADIRWVGYDKLTPMEAARRSGAGELADWLASLTARSPIAPATS
jgi:ankyrin repeat protein